MISRRRFVGGAAGALLVLRPGPGAAQEGVFLAPEEAPRQLYPGSDATERTIEGTNAFLTQVRARLERPPSMWEASYRIFTARKGDQVQGFVVIVEEIGKHRPITYAVAVDPDGTVHDVAVLSYREPYGGEVRDRRFLKQYVGKKASAPLLPYRDIQNISGATLSVEATGRAVKKAVAVLGAAGDLR